jgi:membrane protease YdiL (CAAX protease family)
MAVGVGLLSAQWNVVITGVVYTWLVSAAQWQDFRAHLPFLFDPWSERLPEPPTLTQAMLATYAIFEVTSIVLAIVHAAAGPDSYYVARALSYGVCAGLGGLLTHSFLLGRGLVLRDIIRFGETRPRATSVALFTTAALGLGVVFAFAARAYIQLLLQWPQLGDVVRREAHALAQPSDLAWLLLAGVLFAPLAEEYLFRGLLFRALHREWNDARAIWGSAMFFAIYHPPVAWIPVGLVGATAAWLFKRAGHLVPCVVLHMTYNALVYLLP